MKQEIEAKFINVHFDELRVKLQAIGADCVQPMRLMRRVLFQTPELLERDAFIRVRDEGNKLTVTFKEFKDNTVTGVEETEIEVSNFDNAVAILVAGGLKQTSYQESRRETWEIGEVEVVLDEWPWLDPFVEIEGPSESSVKDMAQRLGFDWSNAVFGSAVEVFKLKYPDGRNPDGLIDIPEVKFGDPLPDKFKPLEPKNVRIE